MNAHRQVPGNGLPQEKYSWKIPSFVAFEDKWYLFVCVNFRQPNFPCWSGCLCKQKRSPAGDKFSQLKKSKAISDPRIAAVFQPCISDVLIPSM